jgi:hypothetical protein
MSVMAGENSLEIDVWGHGMEHRTYAVDQWEAEGDLDDPYGGAWETLYQRMKAIDGTWYTADGFPLRVQIIGIAGEGEAVERFVERWSPLAYQLRETGNIRAPDSESGFLKYRICREPLAIEISTPYYEHQADRYFEIDLGKPGSVDPGELAAKNLYPNLALADVWLSTQVKLAAEKGDRTYTSRDVLEYLEKRREAEAVIKARKEAEEERPLPPAMGIAPIMKLLPGFDDTGINARVFYPTERVDNIFSRMEAALETPQEAAELRIFYLRMKRMYVECSDEMNYSLDVEKAMRWTAYGEAVEDAEFVASITGGKG